MTMQCVGRIGTPESPIAAGAGLPPCQLPPMPARQGASTQWLRASAVLSGGQTSQCRAVTPLRQSTTTHQGASTQWLRSRAAMKSSQLVAFSMQPVNRARAVDSISVCPKGQGRGGGRGLGGWVDVLNAQWRTVPRRWTAAQSAPTQ